MRLRFLFLIIGIAAASYPFIDPTFAYFANGLPGIVINIASCITWVGRPFVNLVFWPIIALLCFLGKAPPERLVKVLQIILICGLVMFVTGTIKITFPRARPELLLQEGIYGFYFWATGDAFRSFPSSHAAIAFGLATIVSKPYRSWFYGVASLIACTRVITNQHFISDILIGSLIGYLIGKKIRQAIGLPEFARFIKLN